MKSMNKINVLILLSVVGFVQACDKGVREVPTPQGHVGRTFVIDRDSELGGIMQSMNDREAQDQLDALRRLAQETSLKQAFGRCDKLIESLDKAIDKDLESSDGINHNYLSRILNFTLRNCIRLKKEFESQDNK